MSIVQALAVVLLFTSVARAQAKPAKPVPDTLVFKNGDQLTGTLERGLGNNIVFKSDMAGEITVSLDNVKELRAHGSFAVLQKGVAVTKASVTPGLVSYSGDTVRVETPAGVSSSVAEKDLAFIVDQQTFNKQQQEPKIWQGWTGAATAGATDVQSTSYGTTFNLNLNLVRVVPAVAWLPPRNRTIFNVSESYGQLTEPVVPQTSPATPNSVAKTSIFHTDFERDQYVSPRFYYLGDLSVDHNFALSIDLQQVYGAGFGWTPIQRPRQQLDLKADVHYESQALQTPTPNNPNQNLIGSTFAESYRLTLPKKIVLTESGNILPGWNNENAYSANGNLNLALPAFHRLTVNFGALDNFINNPSPGYQKNSFQFTTGFGYTFQ